MKTTKSKENTGRGRRLSLGMLFCGLVFLCGVMAVALFINSLFLVAVLTDRIDTTLPRRPSFRDQASLNENVSSEISSNSDSYQMPSQLKSPSQKHLIEDTHPSDTVLQAKPKGHAPILQVFQEAGLPLLNESMIAQLPTWEDVVAVVGEHPMILGLDTCEDFRKNVPAVERMLGSAGMFNSGTNLVAYLLKNNCRIPERVEKYGADASRSELGMPWQVSWGKHSPATYKAFHSVSGQEKINKDWIMPVITVRNPYSWMHSMCNNNYTASWENEERCPNLKSSDGDWNEVTTLFANYKRTFKSVSLVHLWNEWYRLYMTDANYPHLFVRMEDLVFHAKEVTTAVCECVGGKLKGENFSYILDSAKSEEPDDHDTTTGFIEAWIKYSKPIPKSGGLDELDFAAAKEGLDEELMHEFGYSHPPSL